MNATTEKKHKQLLEEIVKFGFVSHCEGYQRCENPYRRGTLKFKSWDVGWLKASNEK